jgi:D-alanyl-D-alanine carboxypeptidase
VVLERGYGLADRGRGIPATSATRYSLAGFTKAVTAAAIAQLAVEGKLSLDDPVSRYVPELTGSKGTATIDQLLTYRDGMARLGAPIFRATERDFLAALNATPADFAPGTGFRYNDFGHSLLGIVIERVTGQRYEDYVRSRFFDPLGLELGFEPDGAQMAVEYQGEAGRQEPIGRRAWHWGRRASLGMVGTARDAHRWLEAIDQGTAITPAARELIMAHRSPTDYGAIQTYGWELNGGIGADPVLRRVAGTPGFEGEILRDDADGWSAVILVNSRLGWRFRIWRLIDRLAAS